MTRSTRRASAPVTGIEAVCIGSFIVPELMRDASDRLGHLLRAWGFEPLNLVPGGHGIVERIAGEIRHRDSPYDFLGVMRAQPMQGEPHDFRRRSH